MSSRYPKFVLPILRHIANLPDAQAGRFLRALRHSFLGDGDKPPEPQSPSSISRETGLRLDSLYDAGVIVCKDRAVSLLREFGIPLKRYAFKKNLTAMRYQDEFGRGPSKVGSKLVFTPLELMRLEQQISLIDLPENLDDLRDCVSGAQGEET